MGEMPQNKEANRPKKGLKIAKRSALPPFLALEVMRKATELTQAGEDIVHLEVGQPSSSAPDAVNHAMMEALKKTPTHGYSVAFGVLPLRERLARHYAEWYDVRPHTDNIAVTVGSSTAFALAFLSAFDAGDKIALPTPGYPAYRNLMQGLGLQAVPLAAGPEQGWRPMLAEMENWEELPDGLMIASPSNPTGTVLEDSELAEICRWCDQHGVRLISDEIYHGLVYGKRADTALNYTKNAIIVNSMSKYFSMTGWRIGWMILPDDLVAPVEKLAQNLFISAPTPNQLAAIAAFDCTDELNAHCQRYAQNREILMKGLPSAMLGGAAPCDGAFYLYADISAFSDNALVFAENLLASEQVAVTPGIDFDPDNGHRYVRLSFAGRTEDMHEACKRIHRFVEARRSDAA